MGIIRDRDDGPDILWASKEILWEETIGSCQVIREKLIRPDGSPVTITTAIAQPHALCDLLIDDRLIDNGIVTEPGGLLIDQKATESHLGGIPGIKPEDFLSVYQMPKSIAVPPSNALWQLGGFFIIDGKVFSLPNDATLNEEFEVITQTNRGWGAETVRLADGKPDQGLGHIKTGISMPLIIKDGIMVPQIEIMARGDLRALADPRNFVDFAGGKKVDSRFWGLVRKWLPTSMDSVTQIATEGGVATVESLVTREEALLFKSIIENAGLTDHWEIEPGDATTPTVARIRGLFPSNRIPVVGIGNTLEGNLVITVADGRQQESSGLTIDELGLVMAKKGAENAGLGSAGGDSVMLTKPGAKSFEILSSPSTTDENGNRVTRPVPSLLVVIH